jgi:hypothetical protein
MIWYVKICLLVKVVFVFALRWNSADFLCTTEKLPCFVQEYRETWSKVMQKEIEDEEYGTIDPKKGKAKAENVNNMHEPSDIDNSHRMSSRVGRLGCMRASCGPLNSIYVPAYG